MSLNSQTPSLSGKVALVTGGSRGIGAAIVQRLAREGAKVAFTYASSAEAAEKLVAGIKNEGGTALMLKADSASETDLRAAVESTKNQLGPLDIFVSNAGVLVMGDISTLPMAEVDRGIAINVRATVIGIQASAAAMNDGGRIITIGSVTGVKTGVPGASVYSLTKAALIGLARGAAIDLAPRRITVNNIQPGPIATDMNPADGPHAGWLTNLIPLKRLGEDSEVASLVAYLSSPEAAFITGASLTIDGGFTA